MRRYSIKAVTFCGLAAVFVLLSFSVRHSSVDVQSGSRVEEEISLKYILQWTNPRNVPFVYMGIGQQGFIDRKCKYTNCYVTHDETILGNVDKFDVIVFAGPEVKNLERLPENRSSHQKYVFASIESADNYPICTNRFDGFFNWTWTYKLDSDSRWGYMIIRDVEGNIIGPNKEMQWMKSQDMLPVNDELKSVIKNKTKAAAWFVSNCNSRSRRETYASTLIEELQRYNMSVDIYGKCGSLKCNSDNERACDEFIEKDYFFYLAFENSFSEDYVTEKLLHALEFTAVPIVYGGANYTRFMPDGIYLDANKLNPREMADKMNDLINDMDKYTEYFRWRNHYSYHRRAASVETDDYCGFCELLNNEGKVKKKTVYEDFRKWWNPPERCYGNLL